MQNYFRASLLIIYNNQKQILLQNRKSISRNGEQRGFFGGGMEKGEDFGQALKREIKEELGLDIPECKLFCNIDMPHEIREGCRKELFFSCYKTDMQEQDFTVLEGDGCRFFDLFQTDFEEIKLSGVSQKVVILLRKHFEGLIS